MRRIGLRCEGRAKDFANPRWSYGLNNSAEEMAAEGAGRAPGDGQAQSHALRRTLGLRDLVPMQILLVVGITWAGTAARQGGTHLWFWLAAIVTIFIPQAAVVGWCARVWPLEGGVYQWTKFALGPFAGFMSAWNFGMWALLAVSNVGIMTATSLSYGLGPRAAWMEENHSLILGLSVGLFLLILLVNLPGFGIGRWVSHFGAAVTVLVSLLLMGLLFLHPHASAMHPHVDPQAPFSFAMPVLTLFSMNLFSKIAFNALTGLEMVAVFAGETRDAGRTILRSAWIAAPIDCADLHSDDGRDAGIYSSGKGGPDGADSAVAGGGVWRWGGGRRAWNRPGADAGAGDDPGAGGGAGGAVHGDGGRDQPAAHGDRVGWDDSGVVHAARSALEDADAVDCGDCGGGDRDGRAGDLWDGRAGGVPIDQLGGKIFYGIYYLMMFAIPLVVGARFGVRAGSWLKLAAASGLAVTLLAMGLNLLPIVNVANKLVFGAKVAGTPLG